MNLHLVLTFEWFDLVESGVKRVEYRAMMNKAGNEPSVWAKRLWKKRDQIETVTFARGYTSTTLKFRVVKIDVGPCPYPGWPGNYYRVYFEDLSC